MTGTNGLRFSGTLPRIPAEVKKLDLETYVPRAVAASARAALEEVLDGARGGTQVGIEMARILSRHQKVPIWVPLKVAQYFPRHERDRSVQERSGPGWVAWRLWGGYAGWNWGRSAVAVVARVLDL